jgi:putative acetyltransferase
MAISEETLTIREFQPGDEQAFRELNEWWIQRHFTVEPADERIFADPQSMVLQPGGRIFFACRKGEPIGCLGLLVTGPDELELIKMGVAERAHGLGAGQLLVTHAVAEARKWGARRLFLETNKVLVHAIALYERAGFRHVPAELAAPSKFSRANVTMEMWF